MKNVMRALLKIVVDYRQLIWEMTKRDVRDRYVGQTLGALWSIGHPLFLMLLYVFIFTYIFPARMGHRYEFPRSYTSYILAGLIPWLTFQEVLNRSVTIVVHNASLVKQIVFPIEVLPVKVVLASMPSMAVASCVLFGIQLVNDDGVPWTWMLLPVVWLTQLVAMTGVAYFLSSIGVYLRDLKDIVQVFISANLFLQPILFLPDRVPEAFYKFFYFNPFSYQVWVYQDLLYTGRFDHTWAWLIYPLGSCLVLAFGYTVFRVAKLRFGEFL